MFGVMTRADDVTKSHPSLQGALDSRMPKQAAEARSFGVEKGAELIRAHVEDVHALFGEGIADFRQGQSFGDFLIQARDDRRRRAAGGHEANPTVYPHLRQSRFRGGWDVRRECRTLRR